MNWANTRFPSGAGWYSEVLPRKNSLLNRVPDRGNVRLFSDVPFDVRDMPGVDDRRPRTGRKKILGVVIRRTYHADDFANRESVKSRSAGRPRPRFTARSATTDRMALDTPTPRGRPSPRPPEG